MSDADCTPGREPRIVAASNVCDFGLLRVYGFFVNMDFLLVILDIFRVMHES